MYKKSGEIVNPISGTWNVHLPTFGGQMFFEKTVSSHNIKCVNNYRFLECTDVVKYCIFRYELAFIVGVTMDRWHHSQLDAVRRINECVLGTALVLFWR